MVFDNSAYATVQDTLAAVSVGAMNTTRGAKSAVRRTFKVCIQRLKKQKIGEEVRLVNNVETACTGMTFYQQWVCLSDKPPKTW